VLRRAEKIPRIHTAASWSGTGFTGLSLGVGFQVKFSKLSDVKKLPRPAIHITCSNLLTDFDKDW
jgi:hypothetical protein